MDVEDAAAEQAATNSAPFLLAGHFASAENQAGYWLLVLNHITSFCETAIGEKASRQVIQTLAAQHGESLQ